MGILGIDFGLKNIGVAVSLWGEKSRPLGTFSLPEVLVKLKKWQEEYGLERIVLGMPSGKMEKRILSWGRKINHTYNIIVEYQDETLTSVEAKKMLLENKVSRKKRKELIDAYAASLILDEYLKNHYESTS